MNREHDERGKLVVALAKARNGRSVEGSVFWAHFPRKFLLEEQDETRGVSQALGAEWCEWCGSLRDVACNCGVPSWWEGYIGND